MLQLAAVIFSLFGAAFVGVKATGVKLPGVLNGAIDNYNFTDFKGNRKYFSSEKQQAWAAIQTQINYILTSAAWGNWRNLDSFKRLTNGGKIDAVLEQIRLNYAGALHGYTISTGGSKDFSFYDFLYPGIDLNNLGAGSENAFQILMDHLNLPCIGSVITGAVTTVASGGTLSVPAAAISAGACAL